MIPGGGGRLGHNYVGCVHPKMKDMGPFSGTEMSENILLKMGVKFAASLNMGKKLSIVCNEL